MNCPKCHTENPDGMKFCSNCGSPLEEKRVSGATAKGVNPLLLKALKGLYMLAGAVAILFVISLQKYTAATEQKWEACEGHCVNIAVEVTSPLTWVSDFEIEAFNYNPPCSYVRKNAVLPPHEALTDANLDKFVQFAVGKYKEKVWANIALFVALTLVFYGLFYYFNKKNQSEK